MQPKFSPPIRALLQQNAPWIRNTAAWLLSLKRQTICREETKKVLWQQHLYSHLLNFFCQGRSRAAIDESIATRIKLATFFFEEAVVGYDLINSFNFSRTLERGNANCISK